jgi:hypothetical protein
MNDSLSAEPAIANDLLGNDPMPPESGQSTVPDNVAQKPPVESMPPGGLLDDSTPGELPSANVGATPMPSAELPRCNCGKIPGTKGPHKLTCPMRGKGRGYSPTTENPSSVAGASSIGAIEPEKPPVDHLAIAGAVFDMTTGIAAGSIGPEWKPNAPDERDMVVKPLAAYFASRDQKDIPPGLLLAFCVTAYCATRITHPNTKSKLVNAYLWFKPKVKNAFGWLTGLFRRKQSALKVS